MSFSRSVTVPLIAYFMMLGALGASEAQAGDRKIPISGGYFIVKQGNFLGGCTVVAQDDGTYELTNEQKGHKEAVAVPVPNNPFRFELKGWEAGHCTFFTVIISSKSMSLVFEKGAIAPVPRISTKSGPFSPGEWLESLPGSARGY